MGYLNFDKPKSLPQWIIFAAATAIILSSPKGARSFIREFKKYLESTSGKNGINTRNISQIMYRFKKRRLISIERDGDKTVIRLTEKGKKKKLEYIYENMRIEHEKSWDKKWRMVFFDIPEKYGNTRRSFVNKIKRLGFLQFQKSVWVYPYNCENEIDFISEVLRIAKFTTLLTVNIEDDKPLKKHFKL